LPTQEKIQASGLVFFLDFSLLRTYQEPSSPE
jgi:hypothetical protein